MSKRYSIPREHLPHRLVVIVPPSGDEDDPRGRYRRVVLTSSSTCRRGETTRHGKDQGRGCGKDGRSCSKIKDAFEKAQITGGRVYVAHLDVREGDWLSPSLFSCFVYGEVTERQHQEDGEVPGPYDGAA